MDVLEDVTNRAGRLRGELNRFNKDVVESHIRWMENRIREAQQGTSGREFAFFNDLANMVEQTHQGLKHCQVQLEQQVGRFFFFGL